MNEIKDRVIITPNPPPKRYICEDVGFVKYLTKKKGTKKMNEKNLKRLMEYSEIEDSEIGETCRLLIQLNMYKDFLSKKFVKELEKELKSYLKMFEQDYEIVELERIEKYNYKELRLK